MFAFAGNPQTEARVPWLSDSSAPLPQFPLENRVQPRAVGEAFGATTTATPLAGPVFPALGAADVNQVLGIAPPTRTSANLPIPTQAVEIASGAGESQGQIACGTQQVAES